MVNSVWLPESHQNSSSETDCGGAATDEMLHIAAHFQICDNRGSAARGAAVSRQPARQRVAMSMMSEMPPQRWSTVNGWILHLGPYHCSRLFEIFCIPTCALCMLQYPC